MDLGVQKQVVEFNTIIVSAISDFENRDPMLPKNETSFSGLDYGRQTIYLVGIFGPPTRCYLLLYRVINEVDAEPADINNANE